MGDIFPKEEKFFKEEKKKMENVEQEGKIKVKKEILEKEIQRLFTKLPSICCDINSHLYIIDALCRKFKQDFNVEISTDY